MTNDIFDFLSNIYENHRQDCECRVCGVVADDHNAQEEEQTRQANAMQEERVVSSNEIHEAERIAEEYRADRADQHNAPSQGF